jgi:signal transduction histidine kinase
VTTEALLSAQPSVTPSRFGADTTSDALTDRLTAQLQQRSLLWIVGGTLVYRLVNMALPAAIIIFRGQSLPFIAVAMMVLLATGNCLALRSLPRTGLDDLAAAKTLVLNDAVLAIVANVVTSASLAGNVLDPFHDVFANYFLGSVLLTSAVYGLRSGLLLASLSLPLHAAMVAFNGQPFTQQALWTIVWRSGLIVAAWALYAGLWAVSRHAARTALTLGVRAGRDAERIHHLRSMHDSVLQTLEAIAASDDNGNAREQLTRVQRSARQQASELRGSLSAISQGLPLATAVTAGQETLRHVLHHCVTEFAAQGLQVEFIDGEYLADPADHRIIAAVRGAVSEALTNVVKHAAVRRVVLRVATAEDGCEVVLRDHGIGFDPLATSPGLGIRHSIVGRLRDVDGTADVWSSPGSGTRITLTIPARWPGACQPA